jgi:hypothetical protein
MAGTRHPFGGGVAEWVMSVGTGNVAVLQSGAVLTFWNSQTGGTQYTDLAGAVDGTGPISAVTSSDGTNGQRLGQVPLFFGPPDITYMWMAADGGPRVAIGSRDSADLVGAIAAQFAQHVAASNPHGTALATLVDVNVSATPANGSVLGYDAASSKWVANSSSGLNPASFVKTAGGSTVATAEGDTTTVGQEWRAPSGNRDTAANLMQALWNAGTASVPSWVMGGYFNGYGEFRARATRDTGVSMRVERRSAGQSGDLEQWVTETGSPLAWVSSKGLIRAANMGRSVMFTSPSGALAAGTGLFVWKNLTGADLILRAVALHLGTAGTTTTIVDVNDNGTTLYATGKPQLTSGQTDVTLATSFVIVAGHTLTVDVDSAGTSAANLTVQLDLY